MKGTFRHYITSTFLVFLASMALAGAAQQKAAATKPKPAVPFIENDYAKALADAQKRNVQIFVDLWAPW